MQTKFCIDKSRKIQIEGKSGRDGQIRGGIMVEEGQGAGVREDFEGWLKDRERLRAIQYIRRVDALLLWTVKSPSCL